MSVATNTKPGLLSRLGLRPSIGFQSGKSRPPVHRRIALPGNYLHWLGLDPSGFSERAGQVNLDCYSFLAADFDLNHLPPFNAELSAGEPDSLRRLTDAIDYACCVQSESMRCQIQGKQDSLRRQWESVLTRRLAETRRQFEKEQPDMVILVQGLEPANACARIAAQQRGIKYLSLENTAITGRLLWDSLSGITSNRNLAKNFYWRFKDSVSAATATEYCRQVISNTKNLKSAEHASPRNKLERQKERPRVLFLGQVYTDSSVIFGLRDWQSPVEIIEQTAAWCEAQQYDFVIKLHPKESNGVNPIDCEPYRNLTARKIKENQRLMALIERNQFLIDHDNGWDTYELIDDSDIVVTLNSQSGLESAIRAKPVVVCGDAFYGNLGFTHEAPAQAFFQPAMNLARETAHASMEESVARHQSACQFAYIFFEKYCREKSVEGLLQLIEEQWL